MRSGDGLGAEPLRALHREAVELAEQLAAGRGDADARFAGGDPAGAVEVVLDGDGRVVGLRLDRGWRDLVGPSGLGPAVVAAVTEALTARLTALTARLTALTARLTATGAPHPSAERRGPVVGELCPAPDMRDPVALLAGGEPGDPDSPESAGHIGDLFALLDTVEAQLAGLTDALQRQTTQQIVARSAEGAVRVTVCGGTVATVDIDPRWLADAPHERIAASALRAAHERAARAVQETMSGFDAVTGLRALGDRPEELLRRLGLLR